MRSAEHRQILQFYVRPRSTAICMARTTLLHNGNGTECFLMFKCLRRWEALALPSQESRAVGIGSSSR